MRKNPIESGEKFHQGKRRQTWEGRAHKKQLFLGNLFSCPVTHLAFSLSLLRTKLSTIVFTCHIFFPITLRTVHNCEEKDRKHNLPIFFGQSPCSCWSEKRSAWMSNCPQNTMKDWFAALFRALTLLGGELNGKPVSLGWNKDVLSAGKEGKLPI